MRALIKTILTTAFLYGVSMSDTYSQTFQYHYNNFLQYTSDSQSEQYDYDKGAAELKLFKRHLIQSLESDFEGTYKYLEEMKEKMIIHLSDDRKVLSLDWDDNSGGTMRFFDGIYCVQHMDHRYKVQEKHKPCKNQSDGGCLNPYTYEMHSVIVPNRDTFYLFFDMVIGSSAVTSHTARVAQLINGQLDFTQAFFKEGDKKSKELTYLMDWSAEVNRESDVEYGSGNLMYDQHAQTIMVPRFEGEKILPGTYKYTFTDHVFIKK